MAKNEYICPKCGSKNKEFPNPIKPSESMINAPEMINNLWQCTDCGYIGVFFVKDKEHKKQKNLRNK